MEEYSIAAQVWELTRLLIFFYIDGPKEFDDPKVLYNPKEFDDPKVCDDPKLPGMEVVQLRHVRAGKELSPAGWIPRCGQYYNETRLNVFVMSDVFVV